jgi:hypothetical protein
LMENTAGCSARRGTGALRLIVSRILLYTAAGSAILRGRNGRDQLQVRRSS